MSEPILLIMAAGMGSRYGGMKQIDPVGPAGEVILDYSLFDAYRAGFRRVVFLIKHEMEEAFRERVGARAERHFEVSYAFQEVGMLPAPFTVPEGRVKPWGTGHAVLSCRDVIDAPFAAINADDYYGVHAFQSAYDFLKKADEGNHYMMVAYELCNTVTDQGYVSRGICSVSEQGELLDVVERTHIVHSTDGPLFTEDRLHYLLLPGETPVSMNMWGFTPSFMQALEEQFAVFLRDTVPGNPIKAEFYLPFAVNTMIREGRATVSVLNSADRWWGVTYQADKPNVVRALQALTDEGVYPSPLWKE
ncbi:MAG: nucleotidyltransferase [Clostridia bacterium]|nr:nucleotidyltransferase [Clostridia bacterium]